MKIVYCIAKTHGSGGMERVLSTKANYLVGKGYEIVIITTDQRGNKNYFPLDDRIQCFDLGIDYEINNSKSIVNKIVHYPFKQRKHKRKLSDLLQTLRADIVISMFCNEASFITDITDGSKKVLEIHFSKFKRLQYGRSGIWALLDYCRSKLDEVTVKKFDRFVVLTYEDMHYWGNLPNIEVIPNSLPFQLNEMALLENKKIIAVGRYAYQKGFDLLIESWAIVNKTYPDWKLDIVGEGELQPELAQQIKEKGLLESAALIPATKRIEEVYLQASVLVMSSRYEGFGMVLLEAQSLGVPVISFACKCGPKDIITQGIDGFLVFEQDVQTLASKIMKLIKDEALRKLMGQAAKQNSKRFSESKILPKWEILFESLIIKK